MKFCPKCSLKIKGNLTYCPLCKVELLSCADDEEGTSQFTNEEQPDLLATELDNIISSVDAINDGGPTSGFRKSVQENTSNNINHTDEDDDPKVRLKKLESNLVSLEKKLSLALRHDGIFKVTVADVESRIRKLDSSLAEIKNSLVSPPECTQDIEKENSKFESQIDQFVGDLESVKNNLRDLHDKINKLSEECRLSMKLSEDNKSKISKLALYAKEPISSFEELQSQSNLSFGEIEIPEEGIKFPKSEGEGFEPDFEPSLSPLSEDDISQSERVKKSKLPLVIILILASIIISLWCGFYFLNSHEQSIQKENIPKKSDIASVPKSVTSVELSTKTRIEESDLEKPKKSSIKSSHSTKSASISNAKTKKKSIPPKKSITASLPSAKSIGYTISVGSFQDKKRAQSITKKLLEKGYPVLMFTSKKNKWYRVRIGAFSSFKDASKYAATLNKKENLPTFITKID